MPWPRPIADLPAVVGEQLAKAWLLELLTAAPLERAPAIASTRVTSAGVALGDAIMAALGDDAALEALCAPGGPAGLLRDVAEAIADPVAPASPSSIVRPPPLHRDAAVSGPGLAPAVVDVAEGLRGAAAACLAPAGAADPRLAAALHDRLAHVVARLTAAALGGVRAAAQAPAEPEVRAAPPAEAAAARAQGQPVSPTFAGRAAAGGPITLVLLELLDAARLDAAGEDSALLGADAALRNVLPPEASVAGDEPGRWTVLAQAEDGMARQLIEAVNAVPGPHGVHLRAAAGVARMPADGRAASDLVAVAEARLLAARAAGVALLA